MKSLCLLACAALVAAPTSLLARLRFEQSTVIVHGDGSQHAFPVAFPFVNEGRAPVRILAIRPACGCTATELAKDVYGPGESGELRAVLNVAGPSGVVAKTIAVETDEPADARHTLTIRAEIVEPVQVAPRLLYWLVGETTAPKTIEVTFAGAAATRLVRAQTSSTAFRIAVVEGKGDPASRVTVSVTPEATDRVGDAELVLAFETRAGNPLERSVRLRVFPRPAGIAPLLRGPSLP